MPLPPADAGVARPKMPIDLDVSTRSASEAMGFLQFMVSPVSHARVWIRRRPI